MKRALLAIAALGAAACAEQPPPAEIAIPGGVILIDEHPVGAAQVLEDRASYQLADGLRLSVQWMPAEDRETGTRTPRSVATAIAERVELGEREGEMAHHACRAGALDAECVGGWTVLDGVRYTRDGFVVAVEGSIVWLDVSLAGEHVGAPSDVAARIRRSFAFRASERS